MAPNQAMKYAGHLLKGMIAELERRLPPQFLNEDELAFQLIEEFEERE